jgi:hypothetical protein
VAAWCTSWIGILHAAGEMRAAAGTGTHVISNAIITFQRTELPRKYHRWPYNAYLSANWL